MKKLLFILFLAFISCKEAKQVSSEKLIVFHASGCYGFCDAYHLQVNKDRSVLLIGDAVYKPGTGDFDTTKMGYFRGVAADSSYNKLVNELQTVDLDHLFFDGTDCCDAPLITIIAYYDGKRKFMESMFPPAKADKLISILYEMCSSSVVQKTNIPFDIEDR